MFPRMPCTPCTKKSFPALESHTRFGDCVKLGVASERHKTTQKGMVPRNIQKKDVVTSRRRVIQHAASWTGPLLFTCERNLSILKSASSLNKLHLWHLSLNLWHLALHFVCPPSLPGVKAESMAGRASLRLFFWNWSQ